MTTDVVQSAMPRDLLLVRHGYSEGNLAMARDAPTGEGGLPSLRTPEFADRDGSDWRLVAEGRAQAARAGGWIRRWMAAEDIDGFDRYYCSPYVRTRETAALLDLDQAEWQLEPLLRERDWGNWSGYDKTETPERFPDSSAQKRRNKFLWRPECGESTPDVDLRVREMLGTFARELAGRRALCVTHEDTMWAFRFRLEKLTIDQWLDQDDGDAHRVVNCAVLHYTRVDAAGIEHPKFVRVRLVDPTRSETDDNWWPIVRPRFTNEELLAQVDDHPRLWGGR